MAHAYTPGLKVTPSTRIRKIRRLPLRGQVLVEEGVTVTPETVVARTNIPGDAMTVNVANILGLEGEDIPELMVKKVGDEVKEGDLLAVYSTFFGLFKSRAFSSVSGTVENISEVTGQVTVRTPPVPVEVHAYVKGKVMEVIPEQGVVVEAEGAFIQGIFGIGGEYQGQLVTVVADPEDLLDGNLIRPEHKGKILVGGSLVTASALKRAAAAGVVGLVAGGIIDQDLVDFLGYDIGVAITGHEEMPFAVIITEGFGRMRMADKTFQLLKSLEGMQASINGATQIRAGVMRPEIIVPRPTAGAGDERGTSEGLVPGTHIRIIREPFFGELAEVVELPPELVVIETEAKVRILTARLADGTVVTVPRANVEIIEE
jgi:transcription antitermination factor NusG